MGMLRPHGRLPQLHFFPAAGAEARLVGGDVTNLAKVRQLVRISVLDGVHLDDFQDLVRTQTPADVQKGLGGNLCRCGTYVGVGAAVIQAAQALQGGRRG